MAADSSAEDCVGQGIEKHQAGDLPAAEAWYRRALAAVPEHPDALHYLGLLSYRAGNVPPGIVLMKRAAELRPHAAHYHGNLGNAYRSIGRRAEAVAAYRQAVRRDPDNAVWRMNFGNVLWEMERLDEALAQLDEAARLDPGLAETHLARGSVCKDLGLLDEAVAAFRRAVELGQGDTLARAHDNHLYALNFHPGYSPGEIFDAHRAWAAGDADPLTADAAPAPLADRDPERRLKVGYVSAFFRSHAVNFFVEPILAAHDRARFEITCYSDVAAPDAVTARLRAGVDHWRQTAGMTDAVLADLVRADGIDILVDLSGHMGASRLLAFARRPAPVQVTYLGYQATTGLGAMDYRLTDDHADPPGATEAWHTETLVRLPRAFFCYQPPAEAPAVVDPPCLKRKTVTFGSFNLFAKVTAPTLEAWADILVRVPGARLQLLVPDAPSLRRRVLERMAARGVAEKRIVFVPRGPRREYLQRYQTVDLALDPFPFNSHTTSCDALWMGVPVVMLGGQSYVQRYGGSALVNLGLDELIAANPADYVETAVRWAADPSRLMQERRALRERMRDSALCDAPGFTRHLEAAYREMWRGRLAASSASSEGV